MARACGHIRLRLLEGPLSPSFSASAISDTFSLR